MVVLGGERFVVQLSARAAGVSRDTRARYNSTRPGHARVHSLLSPHRAFLAQNFQNQFWENSTCDLAWDKGDVRDRPEVLGHESPLTGKVFK